MARIAQDDGYVVNLEAKRGRPGKYRTTDQEVKPETMLPTPEALAHIPPATPPASTATVQTPTKKPAISSGYSLHGGLQTVPADSQPATDLQPVCNPDCNRQSLESIKENEGVCTIARDSEGSTGDNTAPEQIDLEEAIAAAVERDGDLEERKAIQKIDGLLDPEMPEFLRRT